MLILRTIIADLARAYFWMIIVYILLSWFPVTSAGGTLSTVRGALGRLTEPVLTPVRRLVPGFRMGGMGLDLSPIIVLILLQIIIQAVG